MTNDDTKNANELNELEERFGPALGQYVFDQLIRASAVNGNAREETAFPGVVVYLNDKEKVLRKAA